MKKFSTVYLTAYWTTAAVLALVWLAYRLPACGHVCLAMIFIAGGVLAMRTLAEMDRKFKRQRKSRQP